MMMAAHEEQGGGTGQCPPPKRATPPCFLAVCSDERRNGPCRGSAPQRTAARRRQWPGRRNARCTTRPRSGRQFLLPSRSSSTSSRSPAGGRPNLLLEPQGPQLGVQRHTALHIVDILPYVQILDVPVPQLGRGAGAIHAEARHCDARGRLSKCPRSFLTEFLSVLWCVVLRRRRNSWWKCRRSYPTLLWSGLSSRPLTLQFLMIVVAGGGWRRPSRLFSRTGLYSVQSSRFSSQTEFNSAHLASHERSSERIVEQIVEIPVSRRFGGGLQDFRPGQGPTASSDFLASSSVSPGHAGAGGFSDSSPK